MGELKWIGKSCVYSKVSSSLSLTKVDTKTFCDQGLRAMNFCSASLLDLFNCRSFLENTDVWIMLRTLADASGDAGLAGSFYDTISGKQTVVMVCINGDFY